MEIKLTDFAKERKIEPSAVHMYLKRHPELGVAIKKGKDVYLDTNHEDFQILEKKYPLPQLVEIIEDTEVRKKLIFAQETIIKLQNELAERDRKLFEYSKQLIEGDYNKKLLVDKIEQLDRLERKNENLEDQVKSYQSIVDIDKKLIEENNRIILELEKQLEVEKEKSWIQKLFRK